MLAIQDEIIALLAEADCCWVPEQNKSEAVSVLGLAVEEELVRIYAVLDSAANDGEYVEDHWRPAGVRKVQLPNHIGGNCDDDNKADGQGN
jgi:hypothetical protein